MHVSLQSKVCLATCVAINAYAAYSNYANWVSLFVIGLLWGSYSGRSELRIARFGLDIPDDHPNYKTIEVGRENVIKSFISPMPNIEITAINLLALGLISQKIQLPSGWGWGPEIGAFICCGLASLSFGWHVGRLFQLELLQKNQDPRIQKSLDQAII